MKRARGVVFWVLESFGPLLVFYVVEHTAGMRAAIVASIVIGALLVARQIARDRKVSPFTAFVAVSVAVFGTLDLSLTTPFFLKLEPALGNAATAAVFLGSVALGRPVIVEIAEKQMATEEARAKLARARGYLTQVTVAWGLFFVLRAAAYVWMAFRLTLDQTLLVRAVLGPASLVVMVVGEMGVRYLRFGKRAFGGEAAPPPAPVVAADPPARDGG